MNDKKNTELSKEEFEKLVEKEMKILESMEEDFIDYESKEFKDIDFERLDSLPDKEAIEEINTLFDENDRLVEKDYLSSFLEQQDRLVYYEIENIFKNSKTKAYKNRLILKKNPPVLVIKDDLENEARFILTENFTEDLIKSLKEVQRAYYGFSAPKEMDIPDKWSDKVFYFLKRNPLKIIIPIILIIALIILIN